MRATLHTLAGLAALLFAAAGGDALAGTVKSVNAKKKTVAVDLEEDETVEKDTEICFMTEAGKKVDCGSVTKVKGTQALVKVKSAKKLKKIKPGMAAKVGSASDKTAEGKDKAGEGGEEEADSGKSYKGKKAPFRIWGTYTAGLATPAVYNKLGYSAPTDAAPSTLWNSDKKVSQALFGFQLQFGIPLGAFSLNPGFRYRQYTPSLIDADYIPNRENPYVSTEEKATATALILDFQYFRMPFSPMFALNLTSGLDIDQSTVTVKSTKKDDSGGTPESELAKATSKLTVISLRLGAGMDLLFAKVFGGTIGPTLMVPLTETGKTFSGNLADDEARGQADPGEDLKKALGHQKNSLAYELALGIMLAF